MLDETSRAIGQLESAQQATQRDVTELKTKVDAMDSKLDRLLARDSKMKLSLKHWAIILGATIPGGGAVAHVLRKLLE